VIGDAAEIRTKRVRKQKTDRHDAELLLRLLMEDRFPRIWVPDEENRDLRQLLWHRHRLVQMRTARHEPVAGGATTDEPSWSGCSDSIGIRVGHRTAGTFSLRQADRELCGAGAMGGIQRVSATTGPHQQARQFSAALFVSGGAQVTVRINPDWRRQFFHLAMLIYGILKRFELTNRDQEAKNNDADTR
jgi:hypothetical protein